jgi:hypothetical protein
MYWLILCSVVLVLRKFLLPVRRDWAALLVDLRVDRLCRIAQTNLVPLVIGNRPHVCGRINYFIKSLRFVLWST